MRSPRELIAFALLAAAMAAKAGEPVAAPVEQVTRVVGEMKADPALNGHHTEHELRWKNLERSKRERSDAPPWLLQLARWIADAGRGIVWVLGAIGVALIAVFAWRWASVRSDALRARSGLRPGFVNELDIRPESLPADIAAAARVLCQRGELRAALRARGKQLLRGKQGAAFGMHSAFVQLEQLMLIGVIALVVWLAPENASSGVFETLFASGSSTVSMLIAGAYAAIVLLVEPFYVGAGFVMYLNRRVELEAWDVEQELRHAFDAR